MGGPPDLGEDQDATVTISGPEKGASKSEVDTFKKEFDSFKKEMKALRGKYSILKFRVSKITYIKKDPNDSFE
jgi:hypothetical protein